MSARRLDAVDSRCRSELADDEDERHCGEGVSECRGGQRAGESRGGEQSAERRPDELVRRELDGVQAAVRPGQALGGDDVGQNRLGGGVVQRLADPEGEREHVQGPQLLPPRGHHQREQADEEHPGDVDPEHGPPAIEPVRERSRGQGEQQPRQAADEGHRGERARITRDAERDQGQGDLEDPVGQVGQGRGRQQPPEIPGRFH